MAGWDDAVAKLREICDALPEARAQTFGASRHIAFQVGDRRGEKQFAHLYEKPGALRLELQSVDPKVTKDPRFTPRKGWKRWYGTPLDVHDAPTWDELRPLLVESHRLAPLKYDPKELALDPLANAHVILKRAYEAAHPSERPDPPFHLGGPTPVCPARVQIAIAIEALDHVIDFGDAAAKKEARAIVKEVERWTKAVAKDKDVKGDAWKALRPLAKDARADAEIVGIARRAAGAAASLFRNKADIVFTSVAGAVVRAVKLLDAHGKEGARPRDFIRWLDARIAIAEALAAIEEKGKASIEIDRVLLRTGATPDGHATTFVVRANDGRLGLLAKVGNRWSWTCGARDDIAASAPDALFAEVAHALVDGEVAAAKASGNPGGVSAESPKKSGKKVAARPKK